MKHVVECGCASDDQKHGIWWCQLHLKAKETEAERDALKLQNDELKAKLTHCEMTLSAERHEAKNVGVELQESNRLNGEMFGLLRQADELYTGYGLICGPIKDMGYPVYDGKVCQGEWINKIRAIVRQPEKRKCVCRPMSYQSGVDGTCIKCKLPMEKRVCGCGAEVPPSRADKCERCHQLGR